MFKSLCNLFTITRVTLELSISHLCSSIAGWMLSPPVVTICGSTGTGKSKLAIELGSIFRAEVVNADAIQLYEGLPITTNKVVEAETADVPHHLLGVFPAGCTSLFDVHKYRSVCLPILANILEAQHLPILVGGTHYYIEAVLWSDFSVPTASKNSISPQSISIPEDNSECFEKLQQLRPTLAAKLRGNSRKIRAALHRALASTAESRPEVNLELPTSYPANRSYIPRYPDRTLIIWLYCDQNVLNSRLDTRVDDMIQRGLVKELDEFLESFCERSVSDSKCVTDRTTVVSDLFTETELSNSDPFARRGILQTIGFKEFADYLSISPNSAERDSHPARKLLDEAVEKTKTATRQYARRQIKWIVNRFLRRPHLGSLPVYRLDVTEAFRTSSASTWSRDVLAPACRIIHHHMLQVGSWTDDIVLDTSRLHTLLDLCPTDCCPSPCALEPPLHTMDDMEQPDDTATYVCTACAGRVFTRFADFTAHNQSRGHQKRIAKLRKLSLLHSAVSLHS